MRIGEALKAKGVITDFRPPDVIRVAPSPLYNTYHELWKFVQIFKEVIDSNAFEHFPKERQLIS
jgi:kynureninase